VVVISNSSSSTVAVVVVVISSSSNVILGIGCAELSQGPKLGSCKHVNKAYRLSKKAWNFSPNSRRTVLQVY
jgi:hypothetical protein